GRKAKPKRKEVSGARRCYQHRRAPDPIAQWRCNVATHSITRTALYARISTSNNAQPPEMQLRELREHCERRGWTVAGEYVDTGISGAKDRRPELDRLMTDAHRR